MIFNGLAKTIGKARKPAHVHAHGKILPLHVGRANVRFGRLAFDAGLDGSGALGRAVAPCEAGRVAIQLDEHGVVHVASECALNGVQVRLVAVRGELHPVCQPAPYVLHEVVGVFGVSPAYKVGHDQLAVGVQSCPCPSVSSTFRGGLGSRDVLLLRIGECPNFITLDALGSHTTYHFVVEYFAGFARIHQELGNRVERDACDAADRPKAATLTKEGDDLYALHSR